jgi:acetyl esterase
MTHAMAKLRFRLARRLAGLPPRWQVRLSGGRPIVRDGLTLDPQMQMLLALRNRVVTVPLTELAPADARERVRRESAATAGPRIPVGAVTDITVDGAEGPLPARHYSPGEEAPLLVYLHGGGFVICNIDTHDQVCRLLCRYAGVHVVSVDYRLAPEHKFPAAVDDARAALRWAFAHAAELGADPARIAVGGDSAGGNLAAVTAQDAARDGGPAPVFQLLIYPTVDRGRPYPSRDLFAEGFFLTRAEMNWFDAQYGHGENREDPRRAPLRATDLSGLAPALIVTAGFDPLRDEGEAYAAALEAAGTPVTLRRVPSMIHGFINMGDISSSARRATIEIAEEFSALLTTAVV